jgi:hypothetical protein
MSATFDSTLRLEIFDNVLSYEPDDDPAPISAYEKVEHPDGSFTGDISNGQPPRKSTTVEYL